MPDAFAAIVRYLIDRDRHGPAARSLDIEHWLAAGREGPARLTAAFLVALAGPDHPLTDRARAILGQPPTDVPAGLVSLFRTGLESIPREIGERQASDPAFAGALDAAAAALAEDPPDDRAAEAIWSVLYPEAVGLSADIDRSIAALHQRRIVAIEAPNPRPITDAAREVLFTSNVLLGLPLDAGDAERAERDPQVGAAVARARASTQRHWFDHPIPVGVEPEANELLQGLRGLDGAMRAEPDLAKPGPDGGRRRLTCLLSVSATHAELRDIARRYVELELGAGPALEQVDVLVVSETDVRELVDDVLIPAMTRFAPASRTAGDLDILGVDGEYGRHYSFLKAIAAIWHVFVDPGLRATFKIDLDQVFPQAELIAETGRTALQHLETPLWGARGRDAAGRPIELGMVAGALVNASDIGRGLFTPDVPLPGGPRRPSDHVFFSSLPQAISTRAEMMERYDSAAPDGVETALERIHVTGGTNGILVDALRAYRPFTPSFIGRAEDQAYVLSVQGQDGPRLAYLHAAGLVMRHDKDRYAGAAIEAAQAGKLVGDDVRILVFSAYAAAIAGRQAGSGASVDSIKALMDPFTGGFISDLPISTVMVRFALRILEAYERGDAELGRSYAEIGARRLAETLESATEQERFDARIEDERAQWRSLYDTLDAVETALEARDPAALELQRHARRLIDGWRVH
jgi:hypothetical protein